jgi:hypothetical protein
VTKPSAFSISAAPIKIHGRRLNVNTADQTQAALRGLAGLIQDLHAVSAQRKDAA